MSKRRKIKPLKVDIDIEMTDGKMMRFEDVYLYGVNGDGLIKFKDGEGEFHMFYGYPFRLQTDQGEPEDED